VPKTTQFFKYKNITMDNLKSFFITEEEIVKIFQNLKSIPCLVFGVILSQLKEKDKRFREVGRFRAATIVTQKAVETTHSSEEWFDFTETMSLGAGPFVFTYVNGALRYRTKIDYFEEKFVLTSNNPEILKQRPLVYKNAK
jgi:hypothetical protein